MDVHVCLLSDQLLANVIPFLQEGPSGVALVVTPEMASRPHAERLRRFFEERATRVESYHDAPSAGLNEILAYASQLAGDLQDHFGPDARFVLNATGGTKLMALGFTVAFQQAFPEDKLRIIYADTQHGQIETIVPTAAGPTVMENVLDVPTCLQVQGAQYRRARSDDSEWIERAAARRSTTLCLARDAAKLADFFGILNAAVDSALSPHGKLVAPKQPLPRPPKGLWMEAMKLCAKAGVLEWNPGQSDLRFTCAEGAQYVRGGWLEEFVWLAANDCAPFDSRSGVTVTWESEQKRDAPRNEFDLACVHRNRMLLVECKTQKKASMQSEDLSSILYKFDSLARAAGGVLVTKWLVTVNELSPRGSERARQNDIKVLTGPDLRYFRDAVRAWMLA
ncbi:MAG: DUF1887 family protein [Deltaproteobacteria bacterium]|nr:MAG: DUF1887 family protein [Deltaproteobacteria bacterium]